MEPEQFVEPIESGHIESGHIESGYTESGHTESGHTKSGHPGVLLRRHVLPGLGLTVTQAATDLKLTRQTLHRILAGSGGVTVEMALRLERLTGVAATIWLSLQEAYDLRRLRASRTVDISGIPHRGLPAALAEVVERYVVASRETTAGPPAGPGG